MTLSTVAVLRPGDWVLYDGSEHQVLALAGTSVRRRTVDGADSVVLAGHLMASPGFAVVDSEPAPSVEPFALLDSLPGAVLDTAREWERHVVEIETGLPPGAEPGVAPKPEYDPTSTTVVDRDRAKAAELGVGVRTVQTRRARYAQQGLWGLVDQRAVRAWEATGRADARLVAAAREVIDAETDTSTGTRSRLIRRVTKAVEATYGPGVVPMPARTTFYRLIDALATGRHTFGSAVTRRQTANRPQGMFTPTHAARPGEQVQIDSAPIDVLVLLDNGVPVRADLTIAVDIATRTICAAVLRPVGTKAVDAALLLARMLVPEPMRPGWSTALRMSTSQLPHSRLVDIDARMELAAAQPVIVPDTIVIDGGKVFISDTFTRACDRLGSRCSGPGHAPRRTRRSSRRRSARSTRCSVSMSPHIPARTRRCAASTRPARGRCRSCRTCLMSGCWPGGSRAHTMGCATRCCRGGRCRRTRCTPRWSPLRAICR